MSKAPCYIQIPKTLQLCTVDSRLNYMLQFGIPLEGKLKYYNMVLISSC